MNPSDDMTRLALLTPAGGPKDPATPQRLAALRDLSDARRRIPGAHDLPAVRTAPPGGSGRGAWRRHSPLLIAAAAALVVVTATGVASDLMGDRAAETAPATPAAPAPAAPPVPSVPPVPSAEPDWLAGTDLSGISTAQAAEIADRDVTREEYRAAFDRYRGCVLEATGVELQDPLLIDGVQSSPIPAAVLREADACSEREYRYTDTLWQLSPAVQDQSLSTEELRDCLLERGIQPGEDRAEIDEQMRRASLDWDDCLS